jgi:hypothetical protein
MLQVHLMSFVRFYSGSGLRLRGPDSGLRRSSASTPGPDSGGLRPLLRVRTQGLSDSARGLRTQGLSQGGRTQGSGLSPQASRAELVIDKPGTGTILVIARDDKGGVSRNQLSFSAVM